MNSLLDDEVWGKKSIFKKTIKQPQSTWIYSQNW